MGKFSDKSRSRPALQSNNIISSTDAIERKDTFAANNYFDY